MASSAKLSKKMQSKWLAETQAFFERVYLQLRDMQNQLLHPKTNEMSNAEWETIAWNAAWIAAEYFQDRTLKPSRWPAPTNAEVRAAAKRGEKEARV